MARSAAVNESQGFTTDHFGRCCFCETPTVANYGTCSCCGALIEHVRLQPKQEQLLNYVLATGPDVATKIAYGGSRAAGKSRGARDISLVVVSELGRRYPGLPIFIMRRNWTQCKENHLTKFRMERPRLTPYYGDKEYQFPSAMGSPRIVFTYADTPDDIERLERGPECFLMFPDQAEQLGETDLQRINSPNRWPDAGPGAAKTVYLYNPGGPGTPYLKRVFYDREHHENENPDDFKFIQAYGHDNFSWFANEEIVLDGSALTWERFYELPGDIPEPANGKYNKEWLSSLPDYNRFKMYVTKTSEGKKHWAKPESIRMGDLLGKFDSFAGQYMSGIWSRERMVIR